jgi:hypothetical protein
MQMLSSHIQLRQHTQKLQGFKHHPGNVSIPAIVPHAFTPQFITRNPKVPSYSLSEILASRTYVPTPSDGRPGEDYASLPLNGPPIAAAEITTPPAVSGSIETLIEELLNSQQPSLQLYGNELGTSHRELLNKNSPQFSGAIPSHEVLLDYHKQCTHRKDNLFSEILAVLAPSQIVEETGYIAGLWPRITPLSLLCQLTQDRISTLPDQWKIVVTHYAVLFLKYQQSLRMLELSSMQQQEELHQEIDAIRHNVLAESTPDWLLVQVRSAIPGGTE